MSRLLPTRRAAVDDARRRLLREGWPRLQMLLLVMLTGGAGFVAAWGLLEAGVTRMAVRYPLAVLVAYAVFLLLLWLWLRTRAEDWDLSGADGGGGGGDRSVPADWQGGGGHGGGGGASASWDADGTDGALDVVATPVGEALGAVAEAEEFALPLALLVAALAVLAVLLLSSLFLVWSAPVLFAELLVDGVLAAGLYRRLRRAPGRHWLETALRRTWLAFLLTALLAALAGWALGLYAPGATTFGEVREIAASR